MGLSIHRVVLFVAVFHIQNMDAIVEMGRCIHGVAVFNGSLSSCVTLTVQVATPTTLTKNHSVFFNLAIIVLITYNLYLTVPDDPFASPSGVSVKVVISLG